MKISRTKALELIMTTEGEFLVHFIKKNGEARLMKATMQRLKPIKGIGLGFEPERLGYVNVYDVDKGDYRHINIQTLKQLIINDVNYTIES